MHSKNVTDEWRYALTLGRPKFVRPTYWQRRRPEDAAHGLPPPELNVLHFRHLPGIPLWKLAWWKMRGGLARLLPSAFLLFACVTVLSVSVALFRRHPKSMPDDEKYEDGNAAAKVADTVRSAVKEAVAPALDPVTGRFPSQTPSAIAYQFARAQRFIETGHYLEAELEYETMLERELVELPSDHPLRLRCVAALVELLRMQGKDWEASVVDRTKGLEWPPHYPPKPGPGDPDEGGLMTVGAMKGPYSRVGERASPSIGSFYRSVTGIRGFGSHDELNNLAVLLQHSRNQVAELRYRISLLDKQELLGEDHPDVLSVKGNLALKLSS